jgi:uncharacterized protein YuzB (UPF0349 family)
MSDETHWMPACIVTCGICQAEVYAALHLHATPVMAHDHECINICGPCLTATLAGVPAEAADVAPQAASVDDLMAGDWLKRISWKN